LPERLYCATPHLDGGGHEGFAKRPTNLSDTRALERRDEGERRSADRGPGAACNGEKRRNDRWPEEADREISRLGDVVVVERFDQDGDVLGVAE
jgi:hypothetical protein